MFVADAPTTVTIVPYCTLGYGRNALQFNWPPEVTLEAVYGIDTAKFVVVTKMFV